MLQRSQGIRDLVKNTVHGFMHLDIPEPDDSPTRCFKLECPNVILRILEMLPAIDLDDQFHLEAREVSNIPLDGLLPPELEAEWPLAKHVPHLAFGMCRIAAQSPGQRCQTHWHAPRLSQRPLTLTLSLEGEGNFTSYPPHHIVRCNRARTLLYPTFE